MPHLHGLAFILCHIVFNLKHYSLAGVSNVGRNSLTSGRPFKFVGCNLAKKSGFEAAISILIALYLFVLGFCEEHLMVSVRLGFEISGYEREYWVSENGVYAFGFLPDREKEDIFMVGIWYNKKTRGEELMAVWSVGGGINVPQNSTFKLAMDGSFALFDNANRALMWTSNTSNLGVQEASLLDNGNLVLQAAQGRVIWESFCSPTDTLLPNQSLQFPQTLQAPSKRSISGFYSLSVLDSGNLALLWDHNVSYWSSNLKPFTAMKKARFQSDGVFVLYDSSNRAIWSRSSKDLDDPYVSFRHLRIDSDGNLRIYSWVDRLYQWTVGWQAVENQCNVFGSCGLYGVCRYTSVGSFCDCLVKDSLNRMDLGSPLCKQLDDITNCKTSTTMLVLKQTVLYALYPPHDIGIKLNAEACKQYCLNENSCFAATAKNDGSGICTIKKTGFITGYKELSSSSVSFLKTCLVPEAASAHEFTISNVNKTSPLLEARSKGLEKSSVLEVCLLFLITSFVFIMLEGVVFGFICWKRKIKARKGITYQMDALISPNYSALIRLSYEDVRSLTNNFMHVLGPTVYKGALSSQVPVVVKILSDVVVSERELRAAISALGATHHRNLAHLRGFCSEPMNTMMVYEYIDNGSLDQWLFGKREETNKMTWQKRFEISIGVACAISYLHAECHQCIAHGNLKLENVMLDKNMVAKVTDFGLTKLMKSETSSSETLPELDVYMFGEMLLQIFTGRRKDTMSCMYSSLYEMCSGSSLAGIMDSHLKEGSMEWKGVERAIRIAFWCMQDQPFLRPSMGEVVKVLQGTLCVDRPPMPSALMVTGTKEPITATETIVAASEVLGS